MANQYRNLVSEGEKILIDMESALSSINGKERLVLAKRLVELYPLSPRARLILAGEYQVKKDFVKFRELTREGIQRNPNSPLGYRMLASSYLLNQPQDFSLAQSYMEKSIELSPNEPALQIALGDVYRAQLIWNYAYNAYTNAISLDPINDVAYAKRGYVDIYQGYFDQARKDWEMAGNLARNDSRLSLPNNSLISFLYMGYRKIPTEGSCKESSSLNGPKRRMHPLEAPENDHYFCCTVIAMKHGIYVSPYGSMNECESLQREFETESLSPINRMITANITFIEGLHALMQNDFRMAKLKAKEHALLVNPLIRPQKLQVFNYLMGLIYLKQRYYSQAVDYYLKSDLKNCCVKFELGLAYDGLGEWDRAQAMFDEVANNNFSTAALPYMGKYSNSWLNTYEALLKEE